MNVWYTPNITRKASKIGNYTGGGSKISISGGYPKEVAQRYIFIHYNGSLKLYNELWHLSKKTKTIFTQSAAIIQYLMIQNSSKI